MSSIQILSNLNYPIGKVINQELQNSVDTQIAVAFLKYTGDDAMMKFAKEHLNYNHNKGLDFVARFNKQYVIGEAKFLSDFGRHQNAQFNDAISTIEEKGVKAIKLQFLTVLSIKGRNKMYKSITETYKDYNIMSSLVLREFLYQI